MRLVFLFCLATGLRRRRVTQIKWMFSRLKALLGLNYLFSVTKHQNTRGNFTLKSPLEDNLINLTNSGG